MLRYLGITGQSAFTSSLPLLSCLCIRLITYADLRLTEKLPIGKGFSALADLLASIAASVITSSHEVLTTEDFNTAGDPLTSDAKRLPVLQTSDAGYTTAPLCDQAFVDNQLPSIETASTVFDFLFHSLSPFDVEM
ncbi:uncharacterized protein N7484_004977 [Penicillium longicatenatum]|uniref:uncharacterized protein n=1 Tax=Penicillium longicatenatum TaxID=1561947 RepID=UPI002547B4BB|nr:uncharacterized protein N7484_004977 [Penicillium longicatenatum]KAJ5651254.1 hypothetical protein N7484_004977 [Penicillium longicatenatum]